MGGVSSQSPGETLGTYQERGSRSPRGSEVEGGGRQAQESLRMKGQESRILELRAGLCRAGPGRRGESEADLSCGLQGPQGEGRGEDRVSWWRGE